MKKALTNLIAIISMVAVFSFPLQGVSAKSPVQDQRAPSAPQIVVTVAEQPTYEDKDWPITKVDTSQQVDAVTGQTVTVTTVTRKSPTKKVCYDTESVMATTCTYVDSQSRSSISSSVAGVVTHVTHYADHYCTSGCTWNLYKPTRLDVWWTRPGTNVTVSNAVTRWGCTVACQLCDGSRYQPGPFVSSPFTPSWVSSTQSYAYIYTTTPSGPFPPLYAATLAVISGSNEANVYRNGTLMGGVSAYAAYPS
jgi:hypothetical protein